MRGALRRRRKEVFFFENKKQKTFSTWHAWKVATYARVQKFFASFFQKRRPSFFLSLRL